MLLQRVELPRGDLVLLDRVRLSMELAHLVDKAASDRGRGCVADHDVERDGGESWPHRRCERAVVVLTATVLTSNCESGAAAAERYFECIGRC